MSRQQSEGADMTSPESNNAAASSGVSDEPMAIRLVWRLRSAVRDDCGAGASREAFFKAQKAEEELIAEIRRLLASAAPAAVVPDHETSLRERAQLRKQITDLERIKHDLEGRLFDALKTDMWLEAGLEEVNYAMSPNRGVFSKVLDVASVAVARVKELEAVQRIDADKLQRAWAEAYAAFKGAFDGPMERRKRDDEYARDARKRLSAFDELFREARHAAAQMVRGAAGDSK